MSGTINRVILVGRLGRDPETTFSPSGSQICKFSIATDRYKSDKPDWHRIVCFGKIADNCAKYLAKGSHVFIEGSVHYNEYMDKKTGAQRFSTEIAASNVTFLNRVSDQAGPATIAEPAINDENVPF